MRNRVKSFLKHYIIILLTLAIASAFVTYSEITKTQLSEIQDPKYLIILIVTDLVIFICLFALLARKIFRVWLKSKHQSGKLQNKIIVTFLIVAAIPTIIITVFSTIFFNFGIQTWFDKRVSTAIQESVVVAESYFRAQLKLIESDIKIMAQDLNYLGVDTSYGPNRLEQYLDKQADDKGLVEAVIFSTDPEQVIAESKYNFGLPFGTLPENALGEAISDKIVIIKTDEDNKVRALVKLNFRPNTYLLVSRNVDNKVLDHMVMTKGAANEYERLRGRISSLEIQFLVIFLVVSLLLVFVAVWLGIMFSEGLIKPLEKLVSATKDISEGNFDILIPVKESGDEISTLGNAFNVMTKELNAQRKNLIIANNEIEAKHHFSETVLSGVSAGVIALDSKKNISMINKAALNILSIENNANVIGKQFNEVSYEISDLIDNLQEMSLNEIKKEIIINRNGSNLILIVRIITEKFLKKTEGYIITFDDITALVLAQRSAAWSDVARKVAHEIKNPLTPIQLSAERLRRKYSNEVSDNKNFDRYIEIIVKHVKDIGEMVEEFVQFARMPSPNLTNEDLVKIVRDAVFSRKCLDKNIKYSIDTVIDHAIIFCDARQISQVLLNLLKNAEEAIEQNNTPEGEIRVKLNLHEHNVELSVSDNGGGFPFDLFDRLTEPYITTKSIGTGLGLAIVKKVLDDHNAKIVFSNNDQNGATVTIIFNLVE